MNAPLVQVKLVRTVNWNPDSWLVLISMWTYPYEDGLEVFCLWSAFMWYSCPWLVAVLLAEYIWIYACSISNIGLWLIFDYAVVYHWLLLVGWSSRGPLLWKRDHTIKYWVCVCRLNMWNASGVLCQQPEGSMSKIELISHTCLVVVELQRCFQTLHRPSRWHRWSIPTVCLLVAILDLAWRVLRPASRQLNRLKVNLFCCPCNYCTNGRYFLYAHLFAHVCPVQWTLYQVKWLTFVAGGVIKG